MNSITNTKNIPTKIETTEVSAKTNNVFGLSCFVGNWGLSIILNFGFIDTSSANLSN